MSTTDKRLDTASSASRQHYIDTGRYLLEDGADPDRLLVQLVADPPRYALMCPHCGEDASPIRVVDTAVRWTDMDEPDFAARTIPVAYDGSGEFEHDRYECGACAREVQLPEGWQEAIV